MLFSNLDKLLNCYLVSIFQKEADFFEFVNSILWTMHDDVVHNFNEVLVEVCPLTVFGSFQNVSELFELLDLPRSANNGLHRLFVNSRHLN
jgi:hypothetical protein